MNTSFHSFQSFLPNWSGQNVTISINGGNIKARAELLKAPTNEIIPLKFGIRAAAATVKVMLFIIKFSKILGKGAESIQSKTVIEWYRISDK